MFPQHSGHITFLPSRSVNEYQVCTELVPVPEEWLCLLKQTKAIVIDKRSVVVLEESPCPRGSPISNLKVLVLGPEVLVLRQVLVLVHGPQVLENCQEVCILQIVWYV